MAYTILGKIIDSDKNPIPAIVYKSDSKGNVVGTSPKSTQSSEKGEWKLDGINDTDYITVRMLGFTPKTFLAKSVPSIPIMGTNMSARMIQTELKPSEGAVLKEVEVSSPKYVKPDPKPNYAKWILVGGLILIAVGATAYYLNNKNIKTI